MTGAARSFLNDLDWQIVLGFACVVVFWACIRPGAIRDYDDRQLPRKLMTRVFVVAVYSIVYLVLVGALHTGGTAFQAKLSGVANLTVVGWLTANVLAKVAAQQAPYTAFGMLATMMGLAPFRELERRFLIWSHGGSHLHGRTEILTRHLARVHYIPSETERRRSISGLEAFNIFVTSPDTQGIDLPSVNHWRKVNVLLRHVRDWNSGEARALSRIEMAQLDEIANAHERKTRLALGIVNLMARGGSSGAALGQVRSLLAGAGHADRQAVAEAEVGAVLGQAAATAESQPVHIAPGQLGQYLALVNDYFVEEYQILVGQLARLAAKSVVLAGDNAPKRLDDLKAAGFDQLGRIDPIGVDGILKVFLYVGVGGFLVFYLLRYRSVRRELLAAGVDFELVSRATFGMLSMFATISLIMAIAALIGAIVGSKDHETLDGRLPPQHVLLAGLASVGAFFLVHWAQLTYGQDAMVHMRQARIQQAERAAAKQRAEALRGGRIATPAPPAAATPREPVPSTREAPMKLRQLAPWATLPFFITIGICLLARVRRWPETAWISARRTVHIAWERTLDGLTFAALMTAATWIARTLTEVLDLWPAGAPRPKISTIQFYLPTVIFGFVIGATVVRLVRKTAQTRIVETTGDLTPRPTATPSPPPMGTAPALG